MRGAVTLQAWQRNPILSTPRLDAEYYLSWARDIAAGDVLGRRGTIGGEPFLLNPLYAYIIAPIAGLFGATPGPVLVFQVLLAAATAWLTASAARRFAGDGAAWTAGVAVAFSAALTHLDGYVAVSGLAAFLVAGTCFACAPAQSEGERGHGPLAAGAWLGLSALARPVALIAAPFVAWHFARRDPRRARMVLLALAPLAVCAGSSFARNVAVSDEPVVFTAANGQNLFLGNNETARRQRAMFTDEFRFSPREMHEDAEFRVGFELRRRPSRSEVSNWYAARALEELSAHPADSLAWYAQKLRWFFSPQEPASSADLDYDRGITPLLGLAFASTWLIAALAAAGAAVRRDLLLGPGAIVAAHIVACTLAFPLSHYRSPAIPAMAVLAGCAAASALGGLREGRGRPAAVVALVAAAVAATGALAPQPAYQRHILLVNRAVAQLYRGDLDGAERDARGALEIEPSSFGAATVLVDVGKARGRPGDALPWARRLAQAQPWSPVYRADLANVEFDAGRRAEALAEMDRLVGDFPWSGLVRGRRGELRCRADDVERAREDLRFAAAHGYEPLPWAREKCGLP